VAAQEESLIYLRYLLDEVIIADVSFWMLKERLTVTVPSLCGDSEILLFT
jgi:hypothetical protein